MRIFQKIIFTITIWVISCSIVGVFFINKISNEDIVIENISKTDVRRLQEQLNTKPFGEEINTKYTLQYIIILAIAEIIDIEDTRITINRNISNISEWLKNDSKLLQIQLPLDTNTVSVESIDSTATIFISDHSNAIRICTNIENQNIQETGYSATNFCIPKQVENGQINFTSYANQDKPVLENITTNIQANQMNINVEEVEYLKKWRNIQFIFLIARSIIPFSIIAVLVLLTAAYIIQKNLNQSIISEIFNILISTGICIAAIASLLSIILNKQLILSFIEHNSLPGIHITILEIAASVIQKSVFEILFPLILIGLSISVISVVALLLYTKKLKNNSYRSDFLQIDETDVYDQSILLSSQDVDNENKYEDPLSLKDKQIEIIDIIKKNNNITQNQPLIKNNQKQLTKNNNDVEIGSKKPSIESQSNSRNRIIF